MWPAWEVRGHGDTTAWFHVRLAFPDGASVDALAVLNAGRVFIEGVRADPALSLTDLKLLAGWIEAPLSAACGTGGESGGVYPEERLDRGAEEPGSGGGGGGCPAGTAEGPEGTGRATGAAPGRPDRGAEEGPGATGGADRGAAPGGVAADAERPVRPDGAGAGAGRPAGAGGAASDAGCACPRRARQTWPRGIEGRRLLAEEYRAAQDEGLDPVLAVMDATGHSRRRALRLIAQARDAGFLPPRHARR
ncbi:DUF6214 family protein [Streptomyces sp. NPDC012751]|uniref:DUF6214 family protein n=1 Tax=Streptomyces sp. NPDC012751 TaxID=3364846 RepID=UPI0036D02C70